MQKHILMHIHTYETVLVSGLENYISVNFEFSTKHPNQCHGIQAYIGHALIWVQLTNVIHWPKGQGFIKTLTMPWCMEEGCTLSHYNDVMMGGMASHIASLTIVYSTVYSRRRSTKTSELHVTGLCVRNSPVTGEFPHKGPVTRKMFPFDDVIMICPWKRHALSHWSLVVSSFPFRCFPNFSALPKHTLALTCIFDRCRRNPAAVTPVKYECDSKNIIGTLAR